MTKYHKIDNAPIREAVMQARFDEEAMLSAKQLQEWSSTLEQKGFVKHAHSINQVGIEIDHQSKEIKAKKEVEVDGFKLISSDGNYIYILHKDFFTANIVNFSYDDGDDLFERFAMAFAERANIKTAKSINTYSFRCINDLTISESDFSKLIGMKAVFKLKEGPAPTQSTLVKNQFYSDKYDAKATVSMVHELINSGNVKVIFDIDVVSNNIDLMKNKALANVFQNLRDFKNNIFSSNFDTEVWQNIAGRE